MTHIDESGNVVTDGTREDGSHFEVHWYGDEKVVVDEYTATPYFASGNIGKCNGVVIREHHDGTPEGVRRAVRFAINRLPFTAE